jgi:hypothetical protein
MSLVLLQSGVIRTARLPNADLTALTGDAVYSQCLQSQDVLDRPKGTRYFPRRETHRRDIVTAPCSCRWISTWHIKQESDWIWLFSRVVTFMKGAEGSSNLLLDLTVLLENVPRNTKSKWRLSWSHRTITLCTSVESTACLRDGWWWLLEFK